MKDVAYSGKHSSLLRYINNYCSKKYYSAGPISQCYIDASLIKRLQNKLVSGQHFEPSLIFTSKGGAYPSGAQFKGAPKFCNIDTSGQFYKTFYGRKLSPFIIR